MNIIFFAIVFISFLTSSWHQLTWIPAEGMKSPMEILSGAIIESATGGCSEG